MSDSNGSAKDLLLADLEHFSDALQNNEEIGERRFNFFLTVLTSVIAGLVVLHTSEKIRISPEDVRSIVLAAVLGLLVFGLFTYLRLLQRNRVTDEFKQTLKYIRKRLVSEFDMGDYQVPRPVPNPLPGLSGGLAQMVGVMNGILLGAFVLLGGYDYRLAVVLGAAALLAAWAFANHQRKPSALAMPDEYFRAGVGAVILNKEGEVLAIERAGIPGAWQLPQGGLEAGESEVVAVHREITEETGIPRDWLKLRAKMEEPLVYELPPKARSRKTGRGQVQYWFVFDFLGTGALADLPKGREVQRVQWMRFPQLLQASVDFRRPVYRRLAEQFRL